MAAEQRRPLVEHHRSQVNGVRLYYRVARPQPARAGEAGEAGETAFVLLHGWPQTSYAWRKVLPELGRSFPVIAPDLRGLGSSERRGPYDKATIARDVAALLASLGHERYVVVGHDMGALVAHALAVQHPERVIGLVVLEMLLAGFGLEEATGIGPAGNTFWHIPFHLAPAGHPEALTHGREDLYLHRFYHDSLYDPEAFSAEDRAHYVEAYRAPGAMHAGFEWYRALFEDAEFNRRAAARGLLSMPVLAVGGAHRMGGAVRESFARVATSVAGETWERCGHYPHEEQPGRLVARLLQFASAVEEPLLTRGWPGTGSPPRPGTGD
ncbi:alpha/beta fold hydrolase [Nonomuraea sp. NPDC050783]|uniref:alpha/beta fold hydrolase n=1 Tax=Nonomuraea sp. NPDC050783 TaxID=3154634 RepID=UPI0034661FD9